MIYLDYNATTPIDPAVADAMIPYMREQYGNPGSGHVLGLIATEAVEKARERLRNLINGGSGRIVFTGCATEANNLVVKGVAEALYEKGKHLIASTVEHPSIDSALNYLERWGWSITRLRVDGTGLPDPDELRREIRRDTVLVSVMLANNETGTVMPVAELADVARENGVLFHADAAQAIGKIEVDAEFLGVDFLTIAGHKFYAPKGVGALWVRDGVPLAPQIHGGNQEGGYRSGTENVVHIVGLGQAAEIAALRLQDDAADLRRHRDTLHQKIAAEVEVHLIGHPDLRLPNTANLAFTGCKGERVLTGALDIAASLGAACHDRHVTLSPVLAAMGIDPDMARGAVRLSVGRFTTDEQIDTAAEMLIQSARAAIRRG